MSALEKRSIAPRDAPDSQNLPDGHPPITVGRIGVLLVNLGSPAGTDYWSMRRYLKEFLSDRRVIGA
jgi:ferrochelatase